MTPRTKDASIRPLWAQAGKHLPVLSFTAFKPKRFAPALDAMGRAARKAHHRRCNKAMEFPHATAERLEQIPRRPRTRRNIDCGDRDGPVKLAGRRYCAGSSTTAFEKAHDRSGCTAAASASLAEGSQ